MSCVEPSGIPYRPLLTFPASCRLAQASGPARGRWGVSVQKRRRLRGCPCDEAGVRGRAGVLAKHQPNVSHERDHPTRLPNTVVVSADTGLPLPAGMSAVASADRRVASSPADADGFTALGPVDCPGSCPGDCRAMDVSGLFLPKGRGWCRSAAARRLSGEFQAVFRQGVQARQYGRRGRGDTGSSVQSVWTAPLVWPFSQRATGSAFASAGPLRRSARATGRPDQAAGWGWQPCPGSRKAGDGLTSHRWECEDVPAVSLPVICMTL